MFTLCTNTFLYLKQDDFKITQRDEGKGTNDFIKVSLVWKIAIFLDNQYTISANWCYLICIACCTFLNRLFRAKTYSDYALMHLPCLVQFKFYDQAILGQAMTCSQCVSQATCNQLVQVAYHLSGEQAIIHLFVYTNNRFYSNLNLTLPVQRYLVPTSSRGGGGGGSADPHWSRKM